MRILASALVLASLAIVGCQKESSKNEYVDPETGTTIAYGKEGDKFTPTALTATQQGPQNPDNAQVSWEAFFQTAKRLQTMPDRLIMLEYGAGQFSKSPDYISGYARFLETDIKNPKKAEETYRQYIKKDATSSLINANYGMFLHRQGRFEEAKPFILKAETKTILKDAMLTMEIDFAHYAIGPEDPRYVTLKEMLGFLRSGHKMPDFNFDPFIQEAVKKNHSEKDWLPKFADVCKGKADLKTLDSWPALAAAKK